MIDELHDVARRTASMIASSVGQNRWGVINNVRQTDTGYEAKVTIQPEGMQTEWLPVLSPMVGSGWGIVAPPVPGMQAFVLPDSGDANHGVIAGLTFSTAAMPPKPGGNPVKAGQFALVHGNGSYLLFDDNDVTVVTTRDLLATVGRNLTATVTNQAEVIAGQTSVLLDATGGTATATAPTSITLDTPIVNITGVVDVQNTHGGTNAGTFNGTLIATVDVISATVSGKSHVHSDAGGTGDSGPPVP